MSGFSFVIFAKQPKKPIFEKGILRRLNGENIILSAKKSKIYRCKIRAFLPMTANSDRICAKQQKKRCRIAMIQHRR